MSDPAILRDSSLGSKPAANCAAVSKSDTVNYTHPDGSNTLIARGLYVGGAGDVVIVTPLGVAVTFVGVPAGTILPVWHIRVNSTNTTATNMVRLD